MDFDMHKKLYIFIITAVWKESFGEKNKLKINLKEILETET